MSGIIQTTAGGQWAEMPAGTRQDFALTWDTGGKAIASTTWTAAPATAPPIAFSGAVAAAETTVVRIGDGVPGTWYSIQATITTSGGRTLVQSFMLLVTADLPASSRSAIFPFPPAAVANVRRSRLMNLATSHLSGVTITDGDVWSKLKAAEAEAERFLRVWLAPREVLPSHASYDAEAQAKETAGERVEREPGYDYSPAIFQGDRWGMLELRARPIIRIHWARFAYPAINSTVAALPTDWLRPEGRTNRVHIVPTNTPGVVPLNNFVLSALAGGRAVPFMLQIAYRAGIEDVRQALPDLPTLIERMASLALVEDLILPQSGSVSADGLSQSISFEADKHRDQVEAKLTHMRDQLQGIRVTVT